MKTAFMMVKSVLCNAYTVISHFFVHLNFDKKYFVWNKFRTRITVRKFFQFKIWDIRSGAQCAFIERKGWRSERDHGTFPSWTRKQRYPAACVAIMCIKIYGQQLLENVWRALESPAKQATGTLLPWSRTERPLATYRGKYLKYAPLFWEEAVSLAAKWLD